MKVKHIKTIMLYAICIVFFLAAVFFDYVNDTGIVLASLIDILLFLTLQSISRTGNSLFSPITIVNIIIGFQFMFKGIWLGAGMDQVPNNLTLGVLLVTAFLIVYVMSYFLFSRRSISTIYRQAETNLDRGITDSNNKAILFMAVSITIFVVVSISFRGTPLAGFIDPLEFRIYMQHGGMYYFEVIMFFLMITSITIAAKNIFLTENKTSLVTMLILVFAGAVISLGTGLRGRVVEIVLVPLLVFSIIKKKNPTKYICIIILCIIPFVSIYGNYRDASRGSDRTLQESIELLGGDNIVREDKVLYSFMHRFDAMDNFCKVLDEYREFKYGLSFLELIQQPIPRSIWPDKPFIFTSEMTERFRPDLFQQDIALTYSGFAEAYTNFGYFGIILAGIWLGYLVKKLEDIYIKAGTSDYWLLWYICLYQYPFYVLSSGFINDVGNIIMLLYTILCCITIRIFEFRKKK